MEGFKVILIVLAIGVAIASWMWQVSRGRTLLERWAAGNGYRLLEAESRSLVRGPFFWTTGKGQAVYRVTVQDPDGNVRHGWVRCGGWFLGMLSDNVDMRWDVPEPQAPGFPVVLPGERPPPPGRQEPRDERTNG